jgi:hypothetical protein
MARRDRMDRRHGRMTIQPHCIVMQPNRNEARLGRRPGRRVKEPIPFRNQSLLLQWDLFWYRGADNSVDPLGAPRCRPRFPPKPPPVCRRHG